MVAALAVATPLAADETSVVAYVRQYAASTEPTVFERDILEFARAHAARVHAEPAAVERDALAAALAIKAGRDPDPAALAVLEKVLASAREP